MQTANVRTTPSARPAYKRRRRRIKPYIINRCIFAAIALAVIILVIMAITLAVSGARDAQKPAISTPGQTAGQITQTPGTDKNEATETPQTPAVFFALTPEQRTLIEQVVSAESRGEPYDGQVAVAQCILNACLKDDITPEQAIKKYKYTSARVEPTRSVREAVAAVFDRGEGITEEPIIYFYNPAIVKSEFHESQTFVIEIANHKFFKEAE